MDVCCVGTSLDQMATQASQQNLRDPPKLLGLVERLELDTCSASVKAPGCLITLRRHVLDRS